MTDEYIYQYMEDINGEAWCKNNESTFDGHDQTILADIIFRHLANICH